MTDEQKKNEDTETVVVQEIAESAISLITKAEIDMQIATAHAFPRSITKFIKDVMSLATVTPEIAESCVYALPRGDKTVEGPSVRLAEIVASSYGNLRTGARVIYNDGKHVTAQGITHDLEKNIMHTEEVKRSILQNEWEPDPNRPGKKRKSGRMIPMNDDMQTVTGRAACAIAYRNSIFKVVPAALIQDVYERVKQIVRGDVETLGARRKKAIAYFTALGIKEKELFDVIGVAGEEEIDLDKFVLLRGMCSAHRNGEATLEGLFPPPEKKKGDAVKDSADKIKKKGADMKAATDKIKEDLEKEKAGTDEGK